MALASSFYEFLHENLPTWLAHLRNVNESTARRLSNDVEDQATAGDYADANPSSVNVSGAIIQNSDKDEIHCGSSNVEARAELEDLGHPVLIGNKRKPCCYPESRPEKRVRPNDSRRKGTILYDSEAQALLSDIVKNISKAQSMVRFDGKNPQLEHVSTKLNEASELVEDAAFQVLKDGRCQALSNKAVEIFQELYTRSRKALELSKENGQAKVLSPPQEDDEKQPHVRKPWAAQVLAAADKSANYDSQDEELELKLPPIRLTSRVATR